MLSKTSLSRVLAKNVTVFLLIGSIVWIILLVSAADRLRVRDVVSNYRVNFGPITLNQLARQKTVHEYSATITLEKGLLGYFALWSLAGVITGTVTYIKLSDKDSA
jgi:hypothetical protein